MRWGVAVVLLCGIVRAQTPDSKPTGTIHGVVRDSTGAAVAGLQVVASRGRESAVVPGGLMFFGEDGKATTDESGNYALTSLAAGNYTVNVRIDLGKGQTLTSRQVTLADGQDFPLDLTVPAKPAIRGRVLNQAKEPEVDAFVWLLKPEYHEGVLQPELVGPKVTDETGAYSFEENLEANRRYYLLVDRDIPADLKDRDPIEVPTYYPSATRLDAAAPIVLQPGEQREDMNIKVAVSAFACVEGKIQAGGKPAALNFQIEEADLPIIQLARVKGSSAEDGTYHACGLPPGSYRLVTEEGFADFTIADGDVHVDFSAARAHPRLVVEWDQDAAPSTDVGPLDDAGKATLRKLAALAGRGDSLNDDDLTKLAQHFAQPGPQDEDLMAAIMQMMKDPDTAKELGELQAKLPRRGEGVFGNLTETSGGGQFSFQTPIPFESTIAPPILAGFDRNHEFFQGVPPGNYALHVGVMLGVGRTGQASAYIKDVTYDGFPIPDNTLRLDAAAAGTLSVVVGRGTGSIEVTVADQDGKAVPHATVLIVPDSAATVSALSRTLEVGESDQNGNCTVARLAPGKYRVLAAASAVRATAPEDLEKVRLLLYQAAAVDVTADGQAQITVAPISF